MSNAQMLKKVIKYAVAKGYEGLEMWSKEFDVSLGDTNSKENQTKGGEE